MQTPDQDLRAQAAHWVVRLHDAAPAIDGKPSAREDIVGQFKQWIQSSPQHAAAFLRVDDTFCRLAVLDPGHRIDVADLRRQLGNEPTPDPQGTPATRRREVWPRVRVFAWAAAAVIVLASGLWWAVASRAPVYVTGVGEQLNVKLADGSVMTLNTQTCAEVDFSAHTRNIRLTGGEALFEVEHDANRPFIVTTSTARVRAVGTRFDVYQHRAADSSLEADTVVSVLEGVVQVALVQGDVENWAPQPAPAPAKSIDSANASADLPVPGRLAAGEQAKVSRGGMTHRVAPDVTDAVAWRQRELVFHGAPLSAVAAEYNRYNVTQIRIEDPEIGQRLMSGTYSADRPQLLVWYLQRDPSVSVTTRGTDWVIQKR
jgi:transmembrane sensor